MSRFGCWWILAVSCLLFPVTALAQTPVPDSTTTCNFDANTQLAVEYRRMDVPSGKDVLGRSIPYGKAWAPGGKPLTLFTNTPISVGGTQIPDGAYTMFVIPEEKFWTLVISRSTDTSGKYDEAQDLARIRMDYGRLPQAEPEFTAYFAHVAPTQCNLRLDLEKARAWVVFNQK